MFSFICFTDISFPELFFTTWALTTDVSIVVASLVALMWPNNLDGVNDSEEVKVPTPQTRDEAFKQTQFELSVNCLYKDSHFEGELFQ